MIAATMRELQIAKRISVWHVVNYRNTVQKQYMLEQSKVVTGPIDIVRLTSLHQFLKNSFGKIRGQNTVIRFVGVYHTIG